MDLTHLRTFVAVAEEQHLTRAAERLHISQPAASAHIRALEKTFDIVLFERGNRNLELTSAGQTLMHQARQVLAEAQAFKSAARQLSGQTKGSLILGSNNDPALSHIAEVAGWMRDTYPLIALQLQAQSSAAMLQSTRTGELDAAFLLAQSVDDSLGCLILRPVNYCVAGSPKWREALQQADWAALARLPWITAAQGNSYARMLERLFGDKGLEVNSVVETDNDAVIRALIKAGVGISLVREDLAMEAQQAGLMSVWPHATATTQLMFVYPNSRAGDPLISALIKAVKAVWPNAC